MSFANNFYENDTVTAPPVERQQLDDFDMMTTGSWNLPSGGNFSGGA